jgi:uncharacterized membrane protein
MIIIHVWLAALLIATLVAMLSKQHPSRQNTNYEKFKVFVITFIIVYVVLYFSNSINASSEVVVDAVDAVVPAAAIPMDALPGSDVFEHIQVGEPNF